jgi:hypothetical protein
MCSSFGVLLLLEKFTTNYESPLMMRRLMPKALAALSPARSPSYSAMLLETLCSGLKQS